MEGDTGYLWGVRTLTNIVSATVRVTLSPPTNMEVPLDFLTN